jgi:hypothetical protein
LTQRIAEIYIDFLLSVALSVFARYLCGKKKALFRLTLSVEASKKLPDEKACWLLS